MSEIILTDAPKRDELWQLASITQSNKALKRVLKNCDPSLRREVYEGIKQYLCFEPAPFWVLNA
jgi:hypothetical protein